MVVRTSLDPPGGSVVGQPVRLHVDVLFPGSMPRPPRIRLGDAPGAQILRFETQGLTLREAIDGQPYVGQQFEFVVFPRRGGAIEIPSAEITLLDAAGDPAGSARSAVQRIVATVPPGLDASGPVIAATAVTVSQIWEPDPGQARLAPGGALVRTVRRGASGIPAMGMPDLAFSAPDGVRIYADAPRSEDRINRGAVTGERVDRVTYVFERPDAYVLPAIVQPWWDLAARQARSETLPGVTIAVAAASSEARQRQGRTTARAWVAGSALLGALLLGVLVWRLRGRRIARWRPWRTNRAASGAAALSQLRRVAQRGDPGATYAALATWLGRMPADTRQRIRADRRIAPLIDQLERALFGPDGGWSAEQGHALRNAVIEVHRTVRRPSDHPQRVDLPPLNPPWPRSKAGHS
ncbi:protein BatD [Methylobacterium planeticum]|uniref:Protein BatD n=2 Tax=Methylobacterium planeticum TaxID=2615211 RepID=A0A6N6MSW9_9HYPH|nr:protein BatD [Methylobacterium planeticum]